MGRASRPERGQVTAVRTAPQADALGVDIGTASKIQARTENVVELTGPSCAIVESFAEVETVADAAAIVDREHDVSEAGEILTNRVRVVVVIHIMPAEEHLAARASVEKDDGGMLLIGA